MHAPWHELRDWEYVADFGRRRGLETAECDAIIRYALTHPFRKRFHQQGPLLYQDYLYALVRMLRPTLVVETGVRHGVSSVLILEALCSNSDLNHDGGFLRSCDPMYQSEGQARARIAELLEIGRIEIYKKLFERWTFHPGKSEDALPLFLERGCDLFVHDSEHSFINMTWELDTALDAMGPGGLIVCDDWDWNNAAELFCQRHSLDYNVIGSAVAIEV